MKTLINCADGFEAQLIVGRLENEGIQSVVLNENIHGIWPLNIGGSTFSVQVAVNEEDYERALKIISADAE